MYNIKIFNETSLERSKIGQDLEKENKNERFFYKNIKKCKIFLQNVWIFVKIVLSFLC